MLTIEDILTELKQALEAELENRDLADWSIEAAGKNFKDLFNQFPTEDIEDLSKDIEEGLQLSFQLDLTDSIHRTLLSILSDRTQFGETDVDED